MVGRIGMRAVLLAAGLMLAAGGRTACAQEDAPAQMEGSGETASEDSSPKNPAEALDPADAPVPMTPRRSDVIVATPPGNPQPPQLGDIHWIESAAHCRFLREGQLEDPEDPDSWRYLLLIERFYDNQVTIERAYARIDGLIRELALLNRVSKDDGELRTYTTLGENSVTVSVTMKLQARTKAQTRYGGNIVVERNGLSASAKFDGACAPDAANKRSKS